MCIFISSQEHNILDPIIVSYDFRLDLCFDFTVIVLLSIFMLCALEHMSLSYLFSKVPNSMEAVRASDTWYCFLELTRLLASI